MFRFRELILYSNETHRILKARVRALILEFKLNTKVVIEDGFLRGVRSPKSFNKKSTVCIAQAIMAVLLPQELANIS